MNSKQFLGLIISSYIFRTSEQRPKDTVTDYVKRSRRYSAQRGSGEKGMRRGEDKEKSRGREAEREAEKDVLIGGFDFNSDIYQFTFWVENEM